MIRIIALISGFVFAVGLGVSGMVKPQKVIGFLDVFGHWDPSLAMVMIGAIGVHAVAYLVVKRMKTPVLDNRFHLPSYSGLDPKLIIGAILFGAGWGLSGFCPGPALVSVTTLEEPALIFCGSMLVGFGLFSAFDFYTSAASGE